MKPQRHYRLPVGYKMTAAMVKRSMKPPVLLKRLKHLPDDRPHLARRKSRKPVTLAKHA